MTRLPVDGTNTHLVDRRVQWYRNNASKRPPGRCDFARVKKQPGMFTTWQGRFLEKDLGPFARPGRYKITLKKLTPLTHPATTLQQ